MSLHKITPHVKKGRYYNHPEEQHEGFLWRSMQMFARSFYQRMKRSLSNDYGHWFVPSVPAARSYEPSISWIGHATFLIQIGGINILTDPIFGNASLLFPRIFAPGIACNSLPSLDAIIISHNHRDHMDEQSLLQLRHHNAQLLIPEGDQGWFAKQRIAHTPLHWWQQVHIKNDRQEDITFTFLPAYHWSQRGMFDRNRSLWGSWMIEYNNFRIYFAGDTAYSSHFSAINKEFNTIHVALMPIGPCEPREWMKHSHVNAHEAVQGFLDLNAHHFVPMHWGTFYFGIDSFLCPINQLEQRWQQVNDISKQLQIMKIGQSVQFNLYKGLEAESLLIDSSQAGIRVE